MTILDDQPDYLIECDKALTDEQVRAFKAAWEAITRYARYWESGKARYPRLRALDA